MNEGPVHVEGCDPLAVDIDGQPDIRNQKLFFFNVKRSGKDILRRTAMRGARGRVSL